MREEIVESVDRMNKEDLKDVCITLGLIFPISKAKLKKMAYADEAIAEYVLMY